MTQALSLGPDISPTIASEGPRRIAGARKLLLLLPGIGFIWQLLLVHSTQNVVSTLLAAIGSYIISYDAFRRQRLYRYPMSTLVQLGFGITLLFGPLLFTAMEGRPMIDNTELFSAIFDYGVPA